MSDPAVTTTPKKFLYIVTVRNDYDQMFRYGIVSSRKALAEAEALRLAGVGPDVEPTTVQRSELVDSIID